MGKKKKKKKKKQRNFFNRETFMYLIPEAITRRRSVKKDVLRNFAKFTAKHLSRVSFFNKVTGLNLTQVFSCEFCEIFKTLFLTEHLRWLLSDYLFDTWHLSDRKKIMIVTYYRTFLIKGIFLNQTWSEWSAVNFLEFIQWY